VAFRPQQAAAQLFAGAGTVRAGLSARARRARRRLAPQLLRPPGPGAAPRPARPLVKIPRFPGFAAGRARPRRAACPRFPGTASASPGGPGDLDIKHRNLRGLTYRAAR